MIQIPNNCAECPCFINTMYGKCDVNGHWFSAEDGAWFSEQRPDSCPLKDEKTDQNANV